MVSICFVECVAELPAASARRTQNAMYLTTKSIGVCAGERNPQGMSKMKNCEKKIWTVETRAQDATRK